MSGVVDLENVLILILAALIPALIFLVWVRSTEHGQREGYLCLLLCQRCLRQSS